MNSKPRWWVPVTLGGVIAAAVAGGAVAMTVSNGSPAAAHPVANEPAAPAGIVPATTPTTRPQPTGATAAPAAHGPANQRAVARGNPAGSVPTSTRYGARVTAGPVSLANLPGWHSQTITGSGRTQVCLASPDEGCQLDIVASNDPAQGFGAGDLLGEASITELAQCHYGPGVEIEPMHTVRSSQVKLDGVTAEYRVYEGRCRGEKQRTEQWTVATWPAFQIIAHSYELDDSARLHDLVTQTARVRAGSTLRIADFGYLVGYHRQGNVITIDLDRASQTQLTRGVRIRNTNPRIYRYTLLADTRIIDISHLCGPGLAPRATCPLSQVLRRMDGGQHPAGGGPAVRTIPVGLAMDRAGRVARIIADTLG